MRRKGESTYPHAAQVRKGRKGRSTAGRASLRGAPSPKSAEAAGRVAGGKMFDFDKILAPFLSRP